MKFKHAYYRGENSLIIYFAKQASPDILSEILTFQRHIAKIFDEFLIDSIASYTSLLILYDLNKISYAKISQLINDQLQREHALINPSNNKQINIPVYYAPEVGADLVALANYHHLSIEQVINYHSRRAYLVYAVGFMPNFAYLAEVDSAIQMPRLKQPRAQVMPGSVGIADNQTAIYPDRSPAGWQIIGRTPINLSINQTQTIRFKIGDQIKFDPIDQQKYIELGGVL